jgi:hypothetical protein
MWGVNSFRNKVKVTELWMYSYYAQRDDVVAEIAGSEEVSDGLNIDDPGSSHSFRRLERLL